MPDSGILDCGEKESTVQLVSSRQDLVGRNGRKIHRVLLVTQCFEAMRV